MAELLIENVSKQYGPFKAVDDVSFEVKDGEFVVLLGPSGSGKSTILRMVAGLESLTSGKVYIGSRMVNQDSPKRRDVAMVFQNYALYPHMNVHDNIALPLRVRKLGDAEIEKRVSETAELLQITAILRKKPGQISGGEQQRVAVARAVVRQPKVFLFDEPLSNLDAKLRVVARGFLKRLQKELKVTTLYVTHDQAEAMTMADRVAVLNKGRIVQMDEPNEIYDEPVDLFVAGFIGSPPMNLIEGKVISERQQQFFLSGALKIAAPTSDREVVLGIRPEDVKVSDEQQNGSIPARIYVAEPLGSVQYVTLDLQGLHLLAQVDAHYQATINKQVYCSFEPEDFYLFDSRTGKRII